MEMHQIRYFLSLADTLNFTRAAEQCNVAQPSLTRAIKKLEEEVGGELFRRERARTHLTELGRMMRPVLQQTFDSAAAARDLARSFHQKKRAPLGFAISHTIDIKVISPFITEIARAIPGLEVQLFRGDAPQVAEYLKNGQAELAMSGPINEDWERFDSWPLFSENFSLVAPINHELADCQNVSLAMLEGKTLLARPYCEHRRQLQDMFQEHDIEEDASQQVPSDQDLAMLVEAGLGMALVPASIRLPDTVFTAELKDSNLRRTVNLWSVSGRLRSPAADAMMKLLRATNWSDRV